MNLDDSFDDIYNAEHKSQKEFMQAKYPKRKPLYDICLNCGFKLHSPAKNCPNCGKLLDSYKGEEHLEYGKKEQKKQLFLKKIKSFFLRK